MTRMGQTSEYGTRFHKPTDQTTNQGEKSFTKINTLICFLNRSVRRSNASDLDFVCRLSHVKTVTNGTSFIVLLCAYHYGDRTRGISDET